MRRQIIGWLVAFLPILFLAFVWRSFDERLSLNICYISGEVTVGHTLLIGIARWGIWLLFLFFFGTVATEDSKEDLVRGIFECGFALVAAFMTSQILEALWDRPRPFVEFGFEPLLKHKSDPAFPSDHVTVAAVLAGHVFLKSRRFGVLAGVFTIAIGIGRVYCGLHWVSDILAGAFIGLGTRFGFAKLFSLQTLLDPDRGLAFMLRGVRLFVVLYVGRYFALKGTLIEYPFTRVIWLVYAAFVVSSFIPVGHRFIFGLAHPINKDRHSKPQSYSPAVLQISIDCLFFTGFSIVTQDFASGFFLLFLIPIMTSLIFGTWLDCVKVGTLSLASYLISFLAIIWSLKHSSVASRALDLQNLVAGLLLPTASILVGASIAVSWQVTRDQRWFDLLNQVDQSRAFLRSLIDGVPQCIYQIDRDGLLIDVNDQFCRTVGKPRDWLIRRHASELFEPTLAKMYEDDDRQVMETGKSLSKVEANQPIGKEERRVHVIKTPVVKNGVITGVQGIFWDVTEEVREDAVFALQREQMEAGLTAATAKLAETLAQLRASKVRYRGIFDNAGDIIYSHNLQGRFTSMNRAGEKILGYSEEELLGMDIADVVAPEYIDLATTKMHQKESLGREEFATTYELDVITKDAKRLPLEVTSTVIIQNGQPMEVHGIARLILERKKRELDMRNAIELKNTLLHEVHHRVGNYLHWIAGLILQAEGRQQEKESLIEERDVLSSCRLSLQAMALIHDELYPNPGDSKVDLHSYLMRLVGHLREAYLDKSPHLEIALESEKLTVSVDVAMMSGLVINEIVLNALKHAFPSVRMGRISINAWAPQYQLLRLEISDTGVGVSSAGSRTASAGLSLVRSLVSDFGGEITVEMHNGTLIRIELPNKVPDKHLNKS